MADKLLEDSLILENVNDSIIVTDMEGNIKYWNKGAEQVWGYSSEEMLGENVSKLYLDPRETENELEKVKEGVFTENTEWEGRRKDGSRVIVLISTRVMEDKDGVPVGMIGVSKDITAQKIAEEKLEQTTRELESERIRAQHAEEMERMKSHFINTATHEIRTPLTNMKGYLELALEETDLNNVKDYLEVAYRNTIRLEVLTDNLLDQQRIENGRLILDKEKLKLRNLVSGIVEEVEPIFEEKKQVLLVDRPEEELSVFGDEHRLGEVLFNLLDNASKYSPVGSKVKLGYRVSEDSVIFSVKDEGIGLSEEDINEVFKPFPDIDRPIISDQTLGLGLSICQGIVNLHEGNIWVESDGRNKGSTFYFSLPLS